MNRRTKQIIYALIFCGFILIALLFFFLRSVDAPPPSCVDGIRNQDEEGVDCGGACATPCLSAHIEPLALLERVRTFDVNGTQSSAFVEVKNSNNDRAARSFAYTIELYGENDELLHVEKGISFIYALEVRPLFIPLVNVPADQISRAEFTVSDVEWVPARDFVEPNIFVQNKRTEIVGREIRVTGTLVNNDVAAMPSVEVVAVFFGRFNQKTAASLTRLTNVRPGERRDFTVLHPVREGIELGPTEVTAFAFRP